MPHGGEVPYDRVSGYGLPYGVTRNPPEDGAIVLIDDNRDDLFFLKRTLRKGQVAVPIHTFEHPLVGVTFLRVLADAPHAMGASIAVFCDLKMPDMDGFAVLQWVRANGLSDRIRVIIVSGCALEADVERARSLGAAGYLEKMPSAETLLSCLVGPSFPPTGSRPERFKAWEAARGNVVC